MFKMGTVTERVNKTCAKMLSELRYLRITFHDSLKHLLLDLISLSNQRQETASGSPFSLMGNTKQEARLPWAHNTNTQSQD